jgi:hypothetical protein
VEEFVAVLVERVGELVGNVEGGMGVEFESRYRMRASQGEDGLTSSEKICTLGLR